MREVYHISCISLPTFSSLYRGASSSTLSVTNFSTVRDLVVVCALIEIKIAMWPLVSHTSVGGFETSLSVAKTGQFWIVVLPS